MKNIFALIILSVIIISCSKISDKEYFDSALKSLKENKVNEAIKSFETLVNVYPESKLAPQALVQIATIYEGQKIPNISRENSLNSAQKYYLSVYEKYPDCEEAPNSLFRCAFILANEIKNYDLATKYYKLFIEKYPNHNYAEIAKQELDIMGIPPDELLKRNQAALK